MKKTQKHLQDFTVGKLTNSIENAISGDSFKTEVLPLSQRDLKSIYKKNDWRFDWNSEFQQSNRTVYKLIIEDNINIVQGLISLTPTDDNVYMDLTFQSR